MASTYPLITVSIPVYNCEKYIERSIKSVLNQTYPNIEILLVDDKGKDNSVDVIKRVQAKYPDRIRIIQHSENEGLSISRNTGIDNAKGDFLYFLDGDDEITPNCIESLYNLLLKTNATVVIGKMLAKNTFNNTEYEIFPFGSQPEYLNDNTKILQYFCNGAWAVSACNKLFKVNFFRKNQLYFTKGLFSQDELWSFHTVLKLDSIAFLNEFTYYYYLHGESIIFNKTKINFENHQTIVEYFTQAYNEEKKSIRKKYILNHIIWFKELTLTMQWKSLREDKEYWKHNYNRLKKAPSLSLYDYLSSTFTKEAKKKDLFQNLPTKLGYRLFKWRFERK